MQSLLFRGTSRHTVEHLLVVGQNCHTTWNASEFIDLHSCFCRLLVVKLIFRLLTEHSVFLLPYIYCGSFNVSKQRNFGADTQFTVSPIAWWRIDCADLEVFLTKIYCVFYQSFSQPSWETALFFFSFFQVIFFCLLLLSFKKMKPKTGSTSQHADILFLHWHSQRDGIMDESDDRRCTRAGRDRQKVCGSVVTLACQKKIFRQKFWIEEKVDVGP